ncbi:hypothetical protein BN14_09181 [Rhizoctonia solani AG-1 IB]|uniref:Uncharacterized protein n=1 Tax=Thanatephorus cucumeris (strain AG1-IB / isolate 7/3/14) TaxID=1108050 RepID=M5CFW3_THACB|nr:hypothetical protein BN14_09181 [Rhizoctonia solani AG-1 IB]
MVQRRLHYTGERDTKTPADFGGDKANNDDDEEGSDDAGAGTSRGKFAMNGKKRGREDDHVDYELTSHPATYCTSNNTLLAQSFPRPRPCPTSALHTCPNNPSTRSWSASENENESAKAPYVNSACNTCSRLTKCHRRHRIRP